MKDIVKLRPVHLTIKERVKAHVTICVLSYLLIVSIDNKFKYNDNIDMSVGEALEELSDCMVDTIEIEKQNMITRNITKPTSSQKKILEVLEQNKLIKKSYYKKYLKKMEDNKM